MFLGYSSEQSVSLTDYDANLVWELIYFTLPTREGTEVQFWASAVCNGAASRDFPAQKASPSLSEFCRFLGDGVRGLSLLLVQPILI